MRCPLSICCPWTSTKLISLSLKRSKNDSCISQAALYAFMLISFTLSGQLPESCCSIHGLLVVCLWSLHFLKRRVFDAWPLVRVDWSILVCSDSFSRLQVWDLASRLLPDIIETLVVWEVDKLEVLGVVAWAVVYAVEHIYLWPFPNHLALSDLLLWLLFHFEIKRIHFVYKFHVVRLRFVLLALERIQLVASLRWTTDAAAVWLVMGQHDIRQRLVSIQTLRLWPSSVCWWHLNRQMFIDALEFALLADCGYNLEVHWRELSLFTFVFCHCMLLWGIKLLFFLYAYLYLLI